MSAYPTFEIVSSQDKRLMVSVFPVAPLVRVQLRPAQRDGVVLDIHELRSLHDQLGEVIAELEDR